jgi:hypothetical protein
MDVLGDGLERGEVAGVKTRVLSPSSPPVLTPPIPSGSLSLRAAGLPLGTTREAHSHRVEMGGRKMEDGDWNLPCSARRLDHTRLHSCSVAELVPSTASAGRNFEQSSPSATADLSCSASVVTRALCDSRCRFQPPSHVSSHRLGRRGNKNNRRHFLKRLRRLHLSRKSNGALITLRQPLYRPHGSSTPDTWEGW